MKGKVIHINTKQQHNSIWVMITILVIGTAMASAIGTMDWSDESAVQSGGPVIGE